MFMPPTLNNPKLIGEEILSCLVLVLKLCMHMLKEKTRYIFPTTNTTYACLNLDVVRRVIMYLLQVMFVQGLDASLLMPTIWNYCMMCVFEFTIFEPFEDVLHGWMVNKLIFGEFNKINGMYHVLEDFQAFTYFRFWAITPFIK